LWTAEEDTLIREAVQQRGPKWQKIAVELPGRSANALRSRYRRCLAFDVSPPRAAIAEAEGLQLHLSSSSSSGYKGVCEVAPGRFRAVFNLVSLGYFGTAVAAAVAYARHASGEAAVATGAALAQEGGGQAVGQWTREEGRAGQP